MRTQTNEVQFTDAPMSASNQIMTTEIIGSLILIGSAAAIYVKGCFQRANQKADAEVEATEKLIQYQEDRITELELENRQLRQAMEFSGLKAPTVTEERIAEIKETLGVKQS